MTLMMLTQIREFVDWFYNISCNKKVYFLLTIMAFGLFALLKYYEKQLQDKDIFYNNRINSIIVFDKRQLENCNSENKRDFQAVLLILQQSLRDQQEIKKESEKLKLETEKLKLNK